MRKQRILIVDNYDSFTYNLFDYFLQLGTDCIVIRNDECSLDEFLDLSFDGLVLSPGPKRPADAGYLMSLIHHFHDKKPILGICLGHQGIGEYFGAKLTKTILPVHGKTSQIRHNGHPLFQNTPDQFSVMRYHSLGLEQLNGTMLDILAQTKQGEVMAIGHKFLPIHGMQFHPESILTEYGLVLLDNWLEMCMKAQELAETAE